MRIDAQKSGDAFEDADTDQAAAISLHDHGEPVAIVGIGRIAIESICRDKVIGVLDAMNLPKIFSRLIVLSDDHGHRR